MDVAIAAGAGRHGLERMLSAAEDGELPPQFGHVFCRAMAGVLQVGGQTLSSPWLAAVLRRVNMHNSSFDQSRFFVADAVAR